MESLIQALMQASLVTGLAVAMIENGSITANCYGDFEGQTLSNNTVWPVASLTKPIFVYGVLQLVQGGLLELDRPLQLYFPEPYIHDDVYLPHITARHAMSHTTGFPNWRDSQGLHVNFYPGTRYSYSSEGLNYLQYVVEYLLGTSFDKYLHRNVFLPLGMIHSELRRETEATLPPPMKFVLNTMPANGALSLWTTIEDYASFVLQMLGNSISDAHLLKIGLLKEMLTPQIRVGEFPHLQWGLGWGLQEQAGELSFWHWGSRGTPKTMNFAVGWPRAKKAIIVFTDHAEGLYLCRDIITKYFPQKLLPAFNWLLPAHQWRPDGFRSNVAIT